MLKSVDQRMEAVWRGRAQRLARRAVLEEAVQGVVPVIVVGIGRERYGIDLPDVAEVLPPVRVTPVPGALAVFAGVINLHGEIRPVIDLRRLLGMEAVPGELARVVLLRKDGRELGLRIDSVEHVRWIAAAEMQAAGNGAASSRHIKGATSDLLTLLSTEAIFGELAAY